MVRYQTEINENVMNAAIEVSLKMESNVRRRKISAVILVLAGLVLTCTGIVACLGTITGGDAATLLVGIAAIIFGLSQKAYQRAVIKKNFRKTDPIFRSGSVAYEFDPEGIRIQSHLGNGMYHWDSFRKYGLINNCLYIIRRDERVILVNQAALSEEELQELQQLLRQNLPAET